MRVIDLVGQTFNRLTVISRADNRQGKAQWFCKCQCGNTHLASTNSLRNRNISKRVQSCGCLRKQVKLTHGHWKNNRATRTYCTWAKMKARCLNPNTFGYRHYGGRGITVCPRWLDSFENFLTDMGERPVNKTLDRINNNGDYEPGNCRWATPTEQRNNCRLPLLKAA